MTHAQKLFAEHPGADRRTTADRRVNIAHAMCWRFYGAVERRNSKRRLP